MTNLARLPLRVSKGVLITCRPIGVGRLTEEKQGKARLRNDRLICVPQRPGGTAMRGMRRKHSARSSSASSPFRLRSTTRKSTSVDGTAPRALELISKAH